MIASLRESAAQHVGAVLRLGVNAEKLCYDCNSPGGQFVLHAKALLGNPYDGHTLREVTENTQKLTGCEIERGYVDKGYRGHDAPNPHRIFFSGQKRGVFGAIKRELRRRSAIDPVIGHLKAEGHLRRLLAWLRSLLPQILIAVLRLLISRSRLIPAS
jgi:IS5 family transposase